MTRLIFLCSSTVGGGGPPRLQGAVVEGVLRRSGFRRFLPGSNRRWPEGTAYPLHHVAIATCSPSPYGRGAEHTQARKAGTQAFFRRKRWSETKAREICETMGQEARWPVPDHDPAIRPDRSPIRRFAPAAPFPLNEPPPNGPSSHS
jgi:hypothetical protein